jgi:hypothetical protein
MFGLIRNKWHKSFSGMFSYTGCACCVQVLFSRGQHPLRLPSHLTAVQQCGQGTIERTGFQPHSALYSIAHNWRRNSWQLCLFPAFVSSSQKQIIYLRWVSLSKFRDMNFQAVIIYWLLPTDKFYFGLKIWMALRDARVPNCGYFNGAAPRQRTR